MRNHGLPQPAGSDTKPAEPRIHTDKHGYGEINRCSSAVREVPVGHSFGSISVHQRPKPSASLVYPFARNHSTASASARFDGVCGRPSSRIALAGLNHILYFAMRTPASGALGGVPVSLAMASFTCAAVSATKYGIRIFGADTPEISSRTANVCCIVQFPSALPRM